jgi:hypothetical protein
MIKTLLETAGQVLTESGRPLSMSQLQLLCELPSEWDEITQWDEIPGPLIAWLQGQDGLKIDQKPISSNEQLTMACHLLAPSNDSYCERTLIGTLIRAATWYIARVQKQRHESVRDLIIPGAIPHNIVPRKCAKCGERVLDDAFATYASEDPKQYVIWYCLHGCGRPACRTRAGGTLYAKLIPTNPSQGYKVAERRSLLRLKPTPWEDYLLRCSQEERKDLQQEVHTICKACGIYTVVDTKPRWTAETSARYVLRRRRCKKCNNDLRQFIPTDSQTDTISQPVLSKKWKDLKKGGVDPAEYPRRPSILWSKKNHTTKRAELEKERSKEHASEEELDRPPEEPKKRNFNTKTRLQP